MTHRLSELMHEWGIVYFESDIITYAEKVEQLETSNADMLKALEYIAQFNDAAIAGNPTAIRKRAEGAIQKARGQ